MDPPQTNWGQLHVFTLILMHFFTSSTLLLSYGSHPLRSLHPYKLIIKISKTLTFWYPLAIKFFKPFIFVSTLLKLHHVLCFTLV